MKIIMSVKHKPTTTTIPADSTRPVDEQWSEDSTRCPGSDFEKVFTTTSKFYSIS